MNYSSLGPWLGIVLDDNWIGDWTGGGKVRRKKTANASGERVGLAATPRPSRGETQPAKVVRSELPRHRASQGDSLLPNSTSHYPASSKLEIESPATNSGVPAPASRGTALP